MFKKNKGPKPVEVDENGNVLEPEKKGLNWKEIGKKALYVLGCGGLGVLAFFAVGAAMSCVGDSSGENSEDSGEGTDGCSSETDDENASGNIELYHF